MLIASQWQKEKLEGCNPAIFFFLVFFLGPHLSHMEVPRLGVKFELWLPAYITATATLDPSCVSNLCLQQHWIILPPE